MFCYFLRGFLVVDEVLWVRNDFLVVRSGSMFECFGLVDVYVGYLAGGFLNC